MKLTAHAISVALALCAIASVHSCKKRDPESGPATATNIAVLQRWTIDTNNFYPERVFRMNNFLFAVDSTGLLSFEFASIPTASGIFRIGDPKSGADVVSVLARTGTDYASLSGFVTVKVALGKIHVDASNVWMLDVPMFTDSVRFSAQLTEQ